jgi:hypothetical protein
MILSVSGIWRDLSGSYTPLDASFCPVTTFSLVQTVKKEKKGVIYLKIY